MKLTSPAFDPGEGIPPLHTCDGKDVNPPLELSDVPKEAHSLALLVDDLDTIHDRWLHWSVWNIDPATKKIKEGAAPKEAIQGETSFETFHYGGPCPHAGTHRYRFRIFALGKELDIDPQSDIEEIEEALVGNIIDEAELVGTYRRMRRRDEGQ